MKLRKADIIFSKAIKKMRGYKCEKCGAQHSENSRGLHLSHYKGRRKESTRFHEDNVDILCYGCHSYFHQNPHKYDGWKENKLGPERFSQLIMLSNISGMGKQDEQIIEQYGKN